MKKYLMVHGYGHDQMGKAPSGLHGSTTMADLDDSLGRKAAELGVAVESFQSNDPAAVAAKIEAAEAEGFSGLLFNPAVWMNHDDSETIAAALKKTALPVCEVHLGNVNKAGDIVKNLIAPTVTGLVTGFGETVYPIGLQLLVESGAGR